MEITWNKSEPVKWILDSGEAKVLRKLLSNMSDSDFKAIMGDPLEAMLLRYISDCLGGNDGA